MHESRALEIERRLNDAFRRLDDLEAAVKELLQQLPRAWGGPMTESGGDGKVYFAVSDGAAQASGTWPSITPDSFTSDVYDGSSGSLVSVATGATVYWYYVDALTVAGAMVPCVRNSDGTFTGLIESCSDAT